MILIKAVQVAAPCFVAVGVITHRTGVERGNPERLPVEGHYLLDTHLPQYVLILLNVVDEK